MLAKIQLARRAIRSAAIAAESLRDEKRFPQPGNRKIVNHNFARRLEYLELMALGVLGPKRHHGLDRRTARKAARALRNQDGRRFGKSETLARPRPDPGERLAVFGGLSRQAELGGSGSHRG